MDKDVIAQMSQKIETREDLLSLLNYIKRSEFIDMDMGGKFIPITLRQLTYYSNPNHTYHRYIQFKIKKKTPGKFRLITAPRNPSFMALLRYVNEMLKALYTPSDYAFGFAEGRSVVDNAQKHIGMNYVFNTDIEDFFPSIEQPRVWKRLQLPPFNFPDAIARIIAGLCCMRTDELTNPEKGYYRCVLPQGAPTSPIITNMICDTLDRRLAGLARRFGLNYSRYADDITFSSMHNVYQEGSDFRIELKRIIEGQHFFMNKDKTRTRRCGERQEVTGLTVNKKLNVTQKYVRDIRNLLYIWEKYGISVAQSRFFIKYKREKGHVKKGNPDMVNVLDGKLMYLKMVKGENDPVYSNLHDKFESLTATLSSLEKTTEQGITYVETYTVSKFEEMNNTEVTIVPETIREVKQKDANHAEKTTQKVVKRYAYFIMDKKKVKISVNRLITAEEERHKDKLSISFCRDAKGKSFWLLHPTSKETVPHPQNYYIDQLINDLNELLK